MLLVFCAEVTLGNTGIPARSRIMIVEMLREDLRQEQRAQNFEQYFYLFYIIIQISAHFKAP